MDLALRPWRTAALVASAVAALELVLLVALALAALGTPVAQQLQAEAKERAFAPPAAKRRPKPAPAAVAAPALARSEVSILVLNGNGRAGAAREAGGLVRSRGYAVAGVGNAPRSDYARTLVMYRGGREAEARRLAKDVGAKVVAPLDGIAPKELLGAHLALVLGAR